MAVAYFAQSAEPDALRNKKANNKEARRIYYEWTQVFEGHWHSDDHCRCILHHCGCACRWTGALAAGLGAASGLTFAYWAALFLTLIGGICQLIAGIKGVKHSKRSEKAGGLIAWGAIVAVFSALSIVMNLVNGGEFNVTSVLTGVAVPALYIYGAVLNSKADAQYAA